MSKNWNYGESTLNGIKLNLENVRSLGNYDDSTSIYGPVVQSKIQPIRDELKIAQNVLERFHNSYEDEEHEGWFEEAGINEASLNLAEMKLWMALGGINSTSDKRKRYDKKIESYGEAIKIAHELLRDENLTEIRDILNFGDEIKVIKNRLDVYKAALPAYVAYYNGNHTGLKGAGELVIQDINFVHKKYGEDAIKLWKDALNENPHIRIVA